MVGEIKWQGPVCTIPGKLWEEGQLVLSRKTKAEASLTTSSLHSHFPPVAMFFSFPSFPLPPPLDISLAKDAA